ncbi:MAG: hypothetical protein A2Z04_03505 [Chloroflexi bacterium RBG_16_57_9]|nr:MAG: hypothetical protein A2Z04_03505 [Chloroflexi bacterium RBG_16_57_9]
MPLLILLDNTINMRESLRGIAPAVVAQFIAPSLILAIVVLLPWLILRARGATPRETLIGMFTIMLVSAFIFTLSGFLFRGPGFQLFWPWAMPGGYNPLDSF